MKTAEDYAKDYFHVDELKITHVRIVSAIEFAKRYHEYASQFKTVEPYRLERPVEDGIAGTELCAVDHKSGNDQAFSCYEIWRPNIPDDGCKSQCNECKEKQRLTTP